jgi:hypothetical protein
MSSESKHTNTPYFHHYKRLAFPRERGLLFTRNPCVLRGQNQCWRMWWISWRFSTGTTSLVSKFVKFSPNLNNLTGNSTALTTGARTKDVPSPLPSRIWHPNGLDVCLQHKISTNPTALSTTLRWARNHVVFYLPCSPYETVCSKQKLRIPTSRNESVTVCACVCVCVRRRFWESGKINLDFTEMRNC